MKLHFLEGGPPLAIQYETELYAPIKAFFQQRGYEIKAEIRNCDIVGVHPDHEQMMIVEMKKTFSLELVLQGVERLQITPYVYVAVERSQSKRRTANKRWSQLTRLCQHLGLGLLTVTFYMKKPPFIDIQCHPMDKEIGHTSTKPARSKRILNEFAQRSDDYNIGGSSTVKIVTAYREKAVRIALALRTVEESSPIQLARMTNIHTAPSILQRNYYGWFVRVRRGYYKLTPSGQQALITYSFVEQKLPLLLS